MTKQKLDRLKIQLPATNFNNAAEYKRFIAKLQEEQYNDLPFKVSNHTVAVDYKGFRIKVMNDVDTSSEDEYEGAPEGFGLSIETRDYTIGRGLSSPVNIQRFISEKYSQFAPDLDPEELALYAKFEKEYYWLPIYMSCHSGDKIATKPFAPNHGIGLVGMVFMNKNHFKSDGYYGISDNADHTIFQDWANNFLNDEVGGLNYYVTGEVYGYSVTRLAKGSSIVNLVEGEEICSCWNYAGNESRVTMFECAVTAIDSQVAADEKINKNQAVIADKLLRKQGVALVSLLGLKVKDGGVETAVGDRTMIGLAHSVNRIFNDDEFVDTILLHRESNV